MRKQKRARGSLLGVLALALALPLAGACATQQQVDDYEAEILALREERSGLKKENRELKDQLAQYEIALSEAQGAVITAAAPQANEHADLEGIGVLVGANRFGNQVFTLPNELTFASGSADLTSAGKSVLQAVARTLRNDYGSGYYWIEGHTDSDPIRKSNFDSNRDLSLARAMAVLHYLVEDCGIEDDDCKVVGHGEYVPVADNATAEGKARNRRVEIVIQNVQ